MFRAFTYTILVILVLIAGLAWYGHQELQAELDRPLSIDSGESYLAIAPGSGFKKITEILKERGFVQYPQLLRLYGEWTGISRRLRAGEYALLPGDTLRALLEKMVKGEVAQHAITLVDGLTFKEYRRVVESDARLKHEIAELSDDEVMQRLGAEGVLPEGRFYPETYHFIRGTSDLEILKRAYLEMQRVLSEEWSGRAENLPLTEKDQALVLASIVERESGAKSERARVAGVFLLRLKIGMRLQSDPTTIYGLGEKFNGNLTRAQLADPSPYNTYVHSGLPPSPIANPSRASIHAVLHPEEGDYLYFVAEGDGTHYFSKTLAEHNAAVKRFQWKRVKNYRSAPAAQ